LYGASHLPRPIHPDPADRLLIATARIPDATLITGDKSILAHAKAGHVKAVAC
jgi:PIN domain nuclease of toxin-antitoxin system